jgi:hypothetical protein
MQKSGLRIGLQIGSVFVFLTVIVILLQIFTATPVAAQTSDPCIDPFTGGYICTFTPPPPPPRCGVPGTPPCGDPPTSIPTVKYVRPTLTPTSTSSPTPTSTSTPTATVTPVDTLTPTATITLIPTSTLVPSPTPKPSIPILRQIPKLIGLFHPPSDLVALLPSWLSPYNIKLTDLEITQAIQCLHNVKCPDNSVPLFTGKTTLVRAYVRLTSGPTANVNNIGGALCYGSTGAAGCANPILPVKKIWVSDYSDPVNVYRTYTDYTLDFILPYYYVSGTGPQNLTVYVNYKFQDLPGEAFYSDNYKTLPYQVTSSEPLYVRFHPVQNKGVFPPAMEWATLTAYLSKTYPTGEIYPSLGMPLYGKDYAWNTSDTFGCPKGWHDLINDLWYLRGGSGPIAYGEVPYQTLTGASGCGLMGSPAAGGIAGAASDGNTAAQEVGHTMNLPHVPGCGAGGPDLSYPNANGFLDEYGVDPSTLKIYSPLSAFDFMGYCGGGTNTWTSIFTYNKIAGLLPRGIAYHPHNPHQAVQISLLLQPQKVLVGSGALSPTSASLSQGFYLLDRSSFNALTPDQGPYTVELQDTTGQVLYSQQFDLAQMSNDDPQTEGGFRLVLPWTEGTKSIVFKYQDQIIGQTTASSNTPSLALVSPAGGESWSASGQQTITWSASDADNDPLSYMIQYSADNGQTWNILAANLQEESFTFDGDYLPGSDHGMIRVIATDGFNSVQVDSQPISVAEKAPLIVISSPVEAASFDFGTPVILQAIATDIKDGQINNDLFNWSSDKDGNLGNGDKLILSTLSAGTHAITVSVQNSSGLVSTTSVHITINAPASSSDANNLPATEFLPLALLCAIPIVIILSLVVFFMRRKRMKKG